jgi:hypothetical protein
VEKLGLSVYDYVFLGAGLLFLILGWGITNSGKSDAQADPHDP